MRTSLVPRSTRVCTPHRAQQLGAATAGRLTNGADGGASGAETSSSGCGAAAGATAFSEEQQVLLFRLYDLVHRQLPRRLVVASPEHYPSYRCACLRGQVGGW